MVRLCQAIYDRGGYGRFFVAQITSSSTSIVSMLEEAKAAKSDRDFLSKCSVGLKEARESWTRLRICAACGVGPKVEIDPLIQEANEMVSIITAITRNKRARMKATSRK